MNSDEDHLAHADDHLSTSAVGDTTPLFDGCMDSLFVLSSSDSTSLCEGFGDSSCCDDCFACSSESLTPSGDSSCDLSWSRSDDQNPPMQQELDSMGFSLAFPQVESVTIGFSGDILSLHPDPLPVLPIDGPDEYSPEYSQYPVFTQSSSPMNESAPFCPDSALHDCGEMVAQPSDSDGCASDESQFSQPSCRKKRTRKAKHEWTHSEDCRLIAIAKLVFTEIPNKKKGQWVVIAKRFNAQVAGSHLTQKQCREHFNRIMSHHNKHVWQPEENDVICAHMRGELSLEQVEKRLNRTKKQIKERIRTMSKSNGPWSEEEEMKLRELYRQYGGQYELISKEMWSCGFHRDYQQVKNKVTALLKNA